MLHPEVLETHPEMFVEFIKDKTINNSNELTQVKDIEKNKDRWLEMSFENKRV